MKTKLALFTLFALLLTGLVFSIRYNIKGKQTYKQLTTSIEANNQKLQYYETENGNLAAKNQVLLLQNDEFKVLFPQLANEIKDLKVSVERLESVSKTVISQEKQITTLLRDSIIRDTIHAKVFHYKDPFYDVRGIAFGDTQKVSINSVDTLIQTVYRGERKRPWLWIFSKRKLEQSITSKNPNSRIIYSKHVEITKQ